MIEARKDSAMEPLSELTDAELIALYERLDPDNPLVDKVASEMRPAG